jgi:hypothetical protein
MILWESVLGAIEVFAIIASERKVNFDPARFTFHEAKLPNG